MSTDVRFRMERCNQERLIFHSLIMIEILIFSSLTCLMILFECFSRTGSSKISEIKFSRKICTLSAHLNTEVMRLQKYIIKFKNEYVKENTTEETFSHPSYHSLDPGFPTSILN